METGRPVLVWPAGAEQADVRRQLEAVFLAKDLINTPAHDMNPAALADEAKRLGRAHGARVTVTVGEKLLEKNYPTVHAVGRAAAVEPRLVDLRWGKPSDPKITLVGKGVCFDSGGLDIKPAGGMLLMKKDMGGAAIVLGLALAIMSAGLRVRLRVLVPAVENAISGNAFRPLDVIETRKGLTVEVGHTDAEGRLILCDALAEASREKPSLLLDFATLTGSARVALGTELPALFATSDALAADLLDAGHEAHDPFWRLPLHQPYRKQLESRVADLSNVGGSYGGAITAALFLQSFVDAGLDWGHVDVMAWNLDNKPGRQIGGEPMGLRATYAALAARYG
jgi:leucyl aminopeptidase